MTFLEEKQAAAHCAAFLKGGERQSTTSQQRRESPNYRDLQPAYHLGITTIIQPSAKYSISSHRGLMKLWMKLRPRMILTFNCWKTNPVCSFTRFQKKAWIDSAPSQTLSS